jgi:hypothetical protein
MNFLLTLITKEYNKILNFSESFSSNSSGQLDIFGHDSNSLGVDGA